MTKLTHNSFLCICFNSLHVSSNTVLIIRRINCINKTSGIFYWPCIVLWFWANDQNDAQFFSMYLFQFSACFEQHSAHHQENQLYQCKLWYMSPTQSDIHQMLCWYNWFSWWWTLCCSKHVENWNKYIEKNCASIWSFTKNHKRCTVNKI